MDIAPEEVDEEQGLQTPEVPAELVELHEIGEWLMAVAAEEN